MRVAIAARSVTLTEFGEAPISCASPRDAVTVMFSTTVALSKFNTTSGDAAGEVTSTICRTCNDDGWPAATMYRPGAIAWKLNAPDASQLSCRSSTLFGVRSETVAFCTG